MVEKENPKWTEKLHSFTLILKLLFDKIMAMLKEDNGKKVVVALSGGVDSSVTAVLLKKAGYEVIGMMAKFWADPKSTSVNVTNTCCSRESVLTARRLCMKLEIPFHLVDLSQEFRKVVVEYYLNEYKNLRTPNPCSVCNRNIKFGILFEKAREMGADFFATGHYAKIEKKGDDCIISRPVDRTKDQTYFLWNIKKEILPYLLFPLGEYEKREVKKMAQEWELPLATTKESQGVCFIPDRDNVAFLNRYLTSEKGPIIDIKTGQIIGEHLGLHRYTIGQRHGLNLDLPRSYYVLRLDKEKNALVVGEDRDLYLKEFEIINSNWLKGIEKFPLDIYAQIRHGHEAKKAVLEKKDDRYFISFREPQRAVTPGQSSAMYLDDLLIGGGEIIIS